MSPLYNVEAITALETALSKSRFDAYRNSVGGKTALAVDLYDYNARLAGALLFPLEMLEVTLRNTVDRSLGNYHGLIWFDESKFTERLRQETKKSLSFSRRNACEKAGLSDEEIRDLRTCDVVKQSKVRDHLVSDLAFGFWKNLFTKRFYHVWGREFDRAFPYHSLKSMSPNEKPRHMHTQLREINFVRNRVAHYHPIFDLDLRSIETRLMDLIGWISPETSEWTREKSRLQEVIESEPNLRDLVGTRIAVPLSA